MRFVIGIFILLSFSFASAYEPSMLEEKSVKIENQPDLDSSFFDGNQKITKEVNHLFRSKKTNNYYMEFIEKYRHNKAVLSEVIPRIADIVEAHPNEIQNTHLEYHLKQYEILASHDFSITSKNKYDKTFFELATSPSYLYYIAAKTDPVNIKKT